MLLYALQKYVNQISICMTFVIISYYFWINTESDAFLTATNYLKKQQKNHVSRK